MNAIEKPKEPVTDGPTFHKLFVGIEEGKVTSEDLLKAHNADDLSKVDMSHLLTRLFRVRGGKDPGSDWWFKLLRKEAEQTLNYNGQLERFVHPEGAENFFYGITELMKEVEDKGLRGRDVYTRGKEIFEPFFIDYAVKVLGQEPKAENIFEKLPPASEHKGEAFQDDDTNIIYESDGETWTEVKRK